MSLTGKTIGQLTFLESPTADTLIPAELSGETYHIALSGITSYFEVTYDELYSLYTGATLNPGKFYLITDFQTCYDQPNFDNIGNPITSGNYKTGTTEPLLVLATSGNTLSPQAYSPQYPLDKITYDISWNVTEVTSNPAKGRITERIDNRNNRTDYDFRAVQFIRYDSLICESYYSGKVSIDGAGNVTGTNTFFTNDFSPGNTIGIFTPYGITIGGFMFYEILTIDSDTTMTVTGITFEVVSNTYYSLGLYNGLTSPWQCNVASSSGSTEYFTFNDNQSYNTYIGNNSEYDVFILSNNVFLSGNYNDNYFGGNCWNNTFDDDMNANTCGSNFRNNVITNDFDRNTVGSFFENNAIVCDMADNRIGNFFSYNMLGDNDGPDFDNNLIGDNFERNFFTFSDDDFSNNSVGNLFYENVVDGSFKNNEIAGYFYQNFFNNPFDDNTVGSFFYSNFIDQLFYKNSIASQFYSNSFSGGTFNDNIVEVQFNNNTIFDSQMRYNTIGKNFTGNLISSDFEGNTIGYDCKGNIILDTFSQNQFGNAFTANSITGATLNNVVLHSFISNNIYGTFQNNRIGSNFFSNEVLDGFGFGYGQYQGNIIGNNFYDNNIGEYFYNNVIPDNFYNNTIGDYFQWNTVQNYVNGVDFGFYYGNLTAFTYTATGSSAADNIYVGVGGTTDGAGQNATFDIEVSGNAVVGVSGNSTGRYYNVSNTITIPGTSIGGSSPADDVAITVTGISPTPSVYQSYSCQIFVNSGNNTRLSYYNSGDTITITDINL
jgi:hypothetical protein